ncbi:MAG: diaminopimelate decarboxylase [Candidatus Xenobia bacterium]
MRGYTRNAQGHLLIGKVDTVDLVQKYGTPLYVYDEARIRDNCRQYMQAFQKHYGAGAAGPLPHTSSLQPSGPQAAERPGTPGQPEGNFNVLFAGKAFLCKAMVRLILQEGLCLDVVSGGELHTALEAGMPAEKIWFHGNNKTAPEIEMALQRGVGRIVVDSFNELALIERIAEQLGTVADVQLRITPGIKPSTHSYVSTGQLDSKFGFSISNNIAEQAVLKAHTSNRIQLQGLHCHIGSQIFQLESFEVAARMMVEFLQKLQADHGIEIPELNMGGGLGIAYLPADEPPGIAEYVARLTAAVKTTWGTERPLPKLMVEPGRSLVGETGVTLYRVGTVKEIPGIRTYVAVDGGMNDNPRVALYQAKYHAVLADRAHGALEKVSVSGRCCETGDMLVWDIELPQLDVNDVLALFSTGAYHHSMASNYNRLPRPPVVFVLEDRATLVVEGENYQDLVRHDLVPEYLAAAEPPSVAPIDGIVRGDKGGTTPSIVPSLVEHPGSSKA